MPKVLIQFAHPMLEKSRVHYGLLRAAQQVEHVTVNDLYEKYPDFDVDIKREQSLLLSHDIILFQHPFYWYSAPAIIKQWFDLVLEHGWAYGKNGDKLRDKWMGNVLSCGGSENAYSVEGRNRYTIGELLAPVRQTARLCQMQYLPPFVVYGTHKLINTEIEQTSLQYAQLLVALTAGHVQEHEWKAVENLGELCPIPKYLQS